MKLRSCRMCSIVHLREIYVSDVTKYCVLREGYAGTNIGEEVFKNVLHLHVKHIPMYLLHVFHVNILWKAAFSSNHIISKSKTIAIQWTLLLLSVPPTPTVPVNRSRC